MKLSHLSSDQKKKLFRKLEKDHRFRFWSKAGKKRLYVSDFICMEAAGSLENQNTVSAYFDMHEATLNGGMTGALEHLNPQVEFLILEQIRATLVPNYEMKEWTGE